VTAFGAAKFAVRVQVDPDAMAARDIDFPTVQTAVAHATSAKPLGRLNGTQSLTLKTTTGPIQASDYAPLIVAYRNGAPVRLRDIARVIDSVEDDKVAAWFNGARTISLNIFREPGANAVDVVDRIYALLPTLRRPFRLRSISTSSSIARNRSVLPSRRAEDAGADRGARRAGDLPVPAQSVGDRHSVACLAALVFGTLAGMQLCGFSLNNISLMALTLSVGFVVDDAIVMLENIVRHVEAGEAPFAAAMRGSKEIGFTILSITLSLVAVFIPLLFMGGVVGRMFREFAVTVTIAILVSGFVSLTLTPMLCSRLLRHDHGRENLFGRVLERAFQSLLSAYLQAAP
jgi:HAE1 family hydrophobic/amphiphilic exporter-1